LGLVICGAAIALYLLLLLTRAFNEIQAGFVCFILLLVTALLIQGSSAISKPVSSAANKSISRVLVSLNPR
jgi:hypothetical protein